MEESVQASEMAEPERRILGFSRNVFFLGLVSFLTDVSSEMTLTILPLFLANVLGVRLGVIGLIEGVAESTAALLKIGSGWLSDRTGARKTMTAWGYGLSTAAKPFLIIAGSWWMVMGIRMADRIGKGIRTAPRDSLVADSTPAAEMGKSFGFHRAMDSAGAVVGLTLAALVVYLLQQGSLELGIGTYQMLVGIGVLPAVLAVLVILLFVKDARRHARRPQATPTQAPANPLSAIRRAASLQGFDARFKFFLVIVTIFTLGNSSDAFLILRAQNLGLPVAQILVMLVMFNVVYTSVSLPAGMLSDRLGRSRVIVAGWLIYALIYLGFALASELWQVWALFVVYGLYYGAVEGAAKALVADVVPGPQRGTAYGVYNASIGITVLPASIIAGLLWQAVSPAAPFYLGALLAGLAVVLLLVFLRKQ